MVQFLQSLSFLTDTTFYILFAVCVSYIMFLLAAMETKKIVAFLEDNLQEVEETVEEKFGITYDSQSEQEVEYELGMTMTYLNNKKI